MNWKAQLSKIEQEFGFHRELNWQSSIDLVNKLLIKYPNDVELNIRAIYILHNILLEEKYPDKEMDRMIELLQEWFAQSRIKFSNNTEYLFFIGKILHIAEWFFGLKDNRLALDFQKKAMEENPENLLYEWAYRLSYSTDNQEEYLAYVLINNEKSKINWLKTKGFPGEYILEHLRICYEEYLKRNKLK